MNATARHSSRIVRGLAAAGLVAVLATGCQFGVDDDEPTGAAAAEQSEEPAGDDTGSGEERSQSSDGGGESSTGDPGSTGTGSEDDVVDEAAATAGVDLTDLGEPVATAEIPATVDGDDEATMTVQLFGLEKQGGTVVATFAFTVNSTAGSDDPRDLYHYLGGAGWHPYAIDTVNLNKHGVLGGAKAGQTDYQGMRFRSDQTFYAYASFAAPPADVTTMDVMMVTGAPLATGVEIR